jgi:hypothetical protein
MTRSSNLNGRCQCRPQVEDGTLDNTDLPEDGTFEAHNTGQDIEAQAQGHHGCVVVPYPDPCTGQRTS